MPVKLSTTIGKITSLPNGTNAALLSEFHQYMKSNGNTIRVQEIATIVVIAAALGGIAYAISSLYPVSLSDDVQDAIVGGIIGFGSSIGVNLILAYIRRPILSIGAQITERDVDLYPEYMEEDKGELTRR